jgi:hypothetical protein
MMTYHIIQAPLRTHFHAFQRYQHYRSIHLGIAFAQYVWGNYSKILMLTTNYKNSSCVVSWIALLIQVLHTTALQHASPTLSILLHSVMLEQLGHNYHYPIWS